MSWPSTRCYAPTRVALPTLVRIAGTRWAVETCFQNAKGAVGLDQHQVRRWDSWHRYTTLVMLAAAILAAIAATERRRPRQPALTPLTVTEIRRLFAKLITLITRPASTSPGPSGGACTKPAPEPATTAAEATSTIKPYEHYQEF